ncbi:hypothetical protein KXW56_001100 [Aspergillus fumigatus]|nr:hypothetical protein KXX30_003040 [Aspergillus fumigatus]KAH1373392.1 hypothetical protein KXX50_002747 [Aspergillus fumigatus]KAH2445512.1 hypothetical protein KXV83_001418 [Aspergillus fumigatus]KAH2505654.1 hypothetical protein KXV76_006927 [Aspergillus fumigatus]KAH3281144.1 hypothetical protein KXW56_001100 [Aspergillus fumigatus]
MALITNGGPHDVSHVVSGFAWGDLGEDAVVIDVGGADGFVGIALAQAYANLTVFVQDSINLKKEADAKIPPALKSRVFFQPHSFFEPQSRLAGMADVLLLRHILHDWDDNDCLVILRHLAAVLQPGASIIVAEQVLGQSGTYDWQTERVMRALDMQVMTPFGSKERTFDDWETLFPGGRSDIASGPTFPFSDIPVSSSLVIKDYGASRTFFMLAMAASAEETNRQSNAGRRSVISPSEAPPEAEQSDVYQTPPPGLKEWLFILILCSTQLFVQGAFGYILIPLHIVGQTFGQGPSEATRMTWHVGGYSLTVGTFILIAGKLGDLYGSKRILVLGWAWFGVWSVIGGCSAFTHSPVFFDTARALQGIGPALLLPNALAIAGRTYPPGKKKNMIFSAFAVAAPLGCFTAGVVGSVFAQYVWWPWVMWTYSIGCFIIAAVGLWVIPSDYPRCQKAATLQFDYIGSVLGVAGLLLLNISWNQAPIDGRSTPYVYVLLIGGFLVLGLFVLQERRAPGIRSWINFAMCLLWIQQCSSRQGPSQGILPALATPYLMAVITSGWLMAIACAAFLGGCILQSTAPVEQSYWMNTFWSFVIMAWGMDISFPASTTILSDAVPVKHQGASASLVNTVINYSIAIGLGIAGTVEAEVSHQGVNQLRGYRAALWSSVGLAALAFGIALVYAVRTFQEQRSSRKSSQEREQRACIEGCILGLTLTPDREWERVELGRLLSHVSQTGGLRRLQAVSLSLSPSLKCLAGQQSRPCPLVAPVRTICQKKLQQAAHQGFKGIEFFFYEDLETFAAQSSGGASRLNILKGALRIRHLCTSLQLEIIALQPFWFYEGVLDEAEHNRLIDDKLRFWFEICHILHTDMILIPSNFLPPDPETGEPRTTGNRRVIVSDLRQAADLGLAQSPPIRFSYEALAWGNHVDTWEQSWDIVRRVDRPNFGLCLDTFNIAARVYADPASASGMTYNGAKELQRSLARLRQTVDPKRVFLFQVVDGERLKAPLVMGHEWYVAEQPSRMSWSRNARLFAFEEGGYLPVKDIARTVFALGYAGWVSMELFSRTTFDPDPNTPYGHAQRGIASWKTLVTEMQGEMVCAKADSV